ncbi:unnamed protein product [Ectocarpus sp. CCAP 1310/34]|nr:unnamed protein product [Ectocarpus sp. CCAP 1310/34]
MATGSSGEFRTGFPKFSDDPGDYVGWRTLQTSLFMEDKLHKVLLGVEKAPSDPGPSATPDQTSAYQSALEGYQDKNGHIFTRLMLATSETGGYQSAASQTVQAYAPIGSSYNGDGRGAFLALKRKYQAAGVLATPATASLQLERAVPLQVPIAPATAEETEEPAASYEQEKEPPAAIQYEELVAYTNVFVQWTRQRPPGIRGCSSTPPIRDMHFAMFTDDKSRMRWGIPLKTKDEVTVALETLIKEVADAEGICIGKIHCDGAVDFKGRFLAMCRSIGIAVETSPPYVPQGNAVAERGFGTVIGAARSLMLGAPHLPRQLWAEAVKAAIY